MLPTINYVDRPKTKSAIALITHFSETTKDRNLLFGMGGDANVKLCIQHFLSLAKNKEHCRINEDRLTYARLSPKQKPTATKLG
jgi:hypothetical protein